MWGEGRSSFRATSTPFLTQQSIGEYAWKKTITETSPRISHLTEVSLCKAQHVFKISKFVSLGAGPRAEQKTATLSRGQDLAQYFAHNCDEFLSGLKLNL